MNPKRSWVSERRGTCRNASERLVGPSCGIVTVPNDGFVVSSRGIVTGSREGFVVPICETVTTARFSAGPTRFHGVRTRKGHTTRDPSLKRSRVSDRRGICRKASERIVGPSCETVTVPRESFVVPFCGIVTGSCESLVGSFCGAVTLFRPGVGGRRGRRRRL